MTRIPAPTDCGYYREGATSWEEQAERVDFANSHDSISFLFTITLMLQ
jgi:hypothetical protein